MCGRYTDDAGRSFAAVRGLDLSIHDGQIFVLLGHNGMAATEIERIILLNQAFPDSFIIVAIDFSLLLFLFFLA